MRKLITSLVVLLGLILSSNTYAQSVREETCLERMLTKAYKSDKFMEVYITLVFNSVRNDCEFLSYIIPLIYVESRFIADAVSSANAVGIMQITPIAVKELNNSRKELPEMCWVEFRVDKLTDIEHNVRAGSCYFQLMYQRTGSYVGALITYNGGQRQLIRLKRGKQLVNQTANYVTKILYLREVYCEKN